MEIRGAILCVIVFWVANIFQKVFLLNMSYSPICLCTLFGILVGKPTEGLIMGGYLQAIFLGVMAIGGVTPANKQIGSIVPCAFVLLGGLDMTAGLAIAYTVGVLSYSIGRIFTPIFVAAEPYWQKLAAEGNSRKYSIAHWVWFLLISNLSGAIIIFFSVAFGTDAVSAVVNGLPTKLMTGLTAASNCMTAVGIAIALKMCWQKRYAAFFFLGWVLYSVVFNPAGVITNVTTKISNNLAELGVDGATITAATSLSQVLTGVRQIYVAIVAACIGFIWFFVSAELDKKVKKNAMSEPVENGGNFF
ncbi:MAG: PTS sugar transporter subunit IIC [Erysipelotrichaceae bacterium]|nr:PTS sugar transporter subunit IIC [Erysipelotrichaceae bacterium]